MKLLKWYGKVDDGLDLGKDVKKVAGKTPPVVGSFSCFDEIVTANSFLPETLVRMADGSSKQIQYVGIGDWVEAEDTQTGLKGARQVTAVIRGEGEKQMVDITVDGDLISATAGHPFWVINRSAWIDAGSLLPGDLLLTDDGTALAVESVQAYTLTLQTVYNLTVDDLHTYYVMAGEDAILVHNQNAKDEACETLASVVKKASDVNPINHVDDITERVREAASRATTVTEALQIPRRKGRFGTNAHSNFEQLINEINVDLRISGSSYRVRAESFRSPSGIPSGRRVADSLGLDVVLEREGVPIKAFDLKTGAAMSAARRAELARRFDLPDDAIEEILR